MVGKIIIFGGTTEGKELAFALSDAGFDITVSVATDLGLQELTNAALGHLPLALKARKKGRGEKEMANIAPGNLPLALKARKKGRGEKEMANIALGHLPLALKARKKGRGEQELANVVSRGLPFATMAGKMDREEMESVLKCYHLCIDATHPYAVEVTRNLKAACEKVGIRYIRVLRESVEEADKEGKYGSLVEVADKEGKFGSPMETADKEGKYGLLVEVADKEGKFGSPMETADDEGKCGSPMEVADKEGNRSPFVVTANSASEASRFLEETEGNILLTTGSKELHVFSNIPRERLYVRVLPVKSSLEECLEEGIPIRNIIAMFGPFTQKMNEATIEQYDIAYLVTKESGKIGGYKEKFEAARACGTRVIVIRRPEETGLSSGEVLEMLLKEPLRLASVNQK